ncbi:hypothetical protein RB2150_17549 [Rhodobacterales bacterium HTCC2150]|nr:hypothetical protein RB2150_17549 [Rhodobacterales bacterium HTCC2150] [Rhodobacteraceae bacterium HTCC2150]
MIFKAYRPRHLRNHSHANRLWEAIATKLAENGVKTVL